VGDLRTPTSVFPTSDAGSTASEAGYTRRLFGCLRFVGEGGEEEGGVETRMEVDDELEEDDTDSDELIILRPRR